MDEKLRESKIVKTSVVGIAGNAVLVGIKAFIGVLAGSVAIISDAINNFTDALSSIITIIGTKLSGKRADKKHPFGYGRIEYITSTIIALLILFAGATALSESIKSIIEHFQSNTLPEFETYSIIVIAVAVLFKIAIGLFFKKQGKKLSSDSLSSSGSDALFDSVLSFSTVIAAFVAKYLGVYVEGYLGVLIGLFILKSGISAIKESLSHIVGNRFDSELVLNIKKDICEIDGVEGAYDLVLNSYGHNKNIGSVHIGVKDSLTAKEIQKIERTISEIMYSKYGTIMTVGIYAENFNDETKGYYENLLKITKNYPYILQIHGFYVEEEIKLIYFDLVISFDDEKPYETINKVKEDLNKIYQGYTVHINYDQDFSLS